MFEPAVIQQHIRPRGMFTKVTEASIPEIDATIDGVKAEESDRRYYHMRVEGPQLSGMWTQCEVSFSLPKPNTLGVFEIQGLQRFIVEQGIVDLHRYDPRQPLQFLWRDRGSILMKGLNEIFNAAFMEFFMRGMPPTDAEIQTAIDTWFINSTMTQDVPRNWIGLNSLQEMVYLTVPAEGIDTRFRMFPGSMVQRLDPASTPQGHKVGMSYRRTKGSQLKKADISPGRFFSTTVQDFALPASLTPRRMHLLRTALESSLELERYEKPLVGILGPHGRHLRTAIMEYRSYTGEDAIVLSESAAKKLTAIRYRREAFYAIGQIHLKVKVGDHIKPGDCLCECVDPLTKHKTEFFATKIGFASEVDEVVAMKSMVAGIPCIKVSIMCVATVPVANGDKLITRQAVKGVARVVEDNRMPIMPDGRRVEACVSPISVVGRRAMGVYWEMMANQFKRDGGIVVADHFQPSPTFPELVEQGYGASVQLSSKLGPLEEKTYCGLLYFHRLDKLAREVLNTHDGNTRLNGMGIQVDSAKQSGQKRDMAKSLAMLARGMNNIFVHSLQSNMHGQHAFRQLRHVLEPVNDKP